MMQSADNRAHAPGAVQAISGSARRSGGADRGTAIPPARRRCPWAASASSASASAFGPALGGGPAGCSSATTGLGSNVVEAGVVKSPGIADHLHRDRGRLELVQRVGDRETGCQEPAPRPSRVSCSPVQARCWHRRPAGTESSWTCTVGGVGLKASRENEEQPARLAPATAITMTRRMINPSLNAANRHNPRRDHRSVRTAAQPCGAGSLIDG